MLDFISHAWVYVVPFLLVLTLLVTVHELGHFTAARLFGVAVDRFSIGFGKAIASYTDRAGVQWRLGWIPLGGYVRFSGDTNDASLPDTESLAELREQIIAAYGPEGLKRYLHFKPLWQRAIVAAAGPFANFILAFVLFCLLLLVGSQITTPPIIKTVAAGSAAQAAGFQPGDKLLTADGHKLNTFDDIDWFTRLRAGDTVHFDVLRDGSTLSLSATLKRVTVHDEITGFPVTRGQLGVGPNPDLAYVYKAPLSAIPAKAASLVWTSLEGPIRYIGRILTGRENGDQLSGVIGIAASAGNAATNSYNEGKGLEGLANAALMLLQMAGVLSVGIGLANLMPIPVLDGGHLMFYAYEAVARKPLAARIQEASYKVGLALVLGLMLFATWNDLHRVQAFKFLGGLFS